VANPASSGTAYTMIATLVQLMGEDKAFDYMKGLHKNISQYTRSGTGPDQGGGAGRNHMSISFVHDGDRAKRSTASRSRS
jgi:iron(III) transport system substrate-binding protein